MKTIIAKMSIIGLIVLMMASCKKDPEMPGGELVNIKTNEVTEITGFSAVVSAYVGADCDERGVCWGKSANPTVSGSHKASGSGMGSFTSSITGLWTNTTYYVRAYATDSKGTSYGEQKSFTTGPYTGHLYVDLGLPSGLLWATCNIGADSPEDYGDYFAWGETEIKSTYNWSTYKWCNGSSNTLTKYNTDSDYGTVDNKTVLDPEDDAARANLGGDWRMPTEAELRELEDKCTWTWATQGGKNGYRVTGPNGKSIFLPAAGYYHNGSLNYAGSLGYYWSSSLYTDYPYNAYNLNFNSGAVLMYYYSRYYGQSVRPVCPSQK